jgi:hypothetical protein
VRVVARVGSPALSMSSMVDTGRGVGLSTDRPDARIGHRSSWIPPEKKGKHQARWTLNGTKFNGGTFSTRGDRIGGVIISLDIITVTRIRSSWQGRRTLNHCGASTRCVPSALCALCALCYVLCSVLCAVCSVLRALCSVLRAPCSVLRAPCSVLCVACYVFTLSRFLFSRQF